MTGGDGSSFGMPLALAVASVDGPIGSLGATCSRGMPGERVG